MAGDPWELLGVRRDASKEELRAAYRRLASTLHPDRLATAPEADRRAAEEQLQAVGEAYALARAAVDARERSAAGRPVDDGFATPPPFSAAPGEAATRGPGQGWDLGGRARGDGGADGEEEGEEAVVHAGRGCGLVTLLILGVLGVVFVGTALLTGDRTAQDAPAVPPWRLPSIRASAAPLAYDAWRSSPAAAKCLLLVPTSVRGEPETALVTGGWSGDWSGVGITTRADRNDIPEADADDVPLVWTDGTRGVARPAGATGWTAVFVVNGETCRHEVRADGDFDDLARALGGLRQVTAA